jgi:acetyl esterase/lipase
MSFILERSCQLSASADALRVLLGAILCGRKQAPVLGTQETGAALMSAEKQTYTYKQVRKHEIKADVYQTGAGETRPVIVWLHGGCLIMGHRGDIAAWQLDLYLEAGYTVVCADYRLAPETKLPAIIDDLQDVFHWVREEGPRLFQADPSRVAALGHSAGGYLALMSGVVCDPRPTAIVSFYGYGDIVGDWYSRPDPYYLQQPIMPRQKAYRAVGKEVISGTPDPHNRGDFYLYLRQQGLWPLEVSGHDPETEPGFFHLYCPVRSVNREYPPTLLLHGEKDTDVPYEQSAMMAAALAKAQVEHELVTISGGDHGFDAERNEVSERAMYKVLAFLGRYLG